MPRKSSQSASKPAPKSKPHATASAAPKPAKSKPSASKKPVTAAKGKTASKQTESVKATPPRSTKQSQLIALLRSASGGTLEQMSKLTGWQAHTVRATISAVLRKRLGLDVQSIANADGPRIYRIAKSVVA